MGMKNLDSCSALKTVTLWFTPQSFLWLLTIYNFFVYFDAIFIDEASQIDDHTCDLLDYAVHELPHNPFIAVSADYKQLQPVGR